MDRNTIRGNNFKVMRTYKINYWAERNDVAVDLQTIIEAEDIEQAIAKFDRKTIYRRIVKIKEI